MPRTKPLISFEYVVENVTFDHNPQLVDGREQQQQGQPQLVDQHRHQRLAHHNAVHLQALDSFQDDEEARAQKDRFPSLWLRGFLLNVFLAFFLLTRKRHRHDLERYVETREDGGLQPQLVVAVLEPAHWLPHSLCKSCWSLSLAKVRRQVKSDFLCHQTHAISI